jgi:hypothetical protein
MFEGKEKMSFMVVDKHYAKNVKCLEGHTMVLYDGSHPSYGPKYNYAMC